MTLSGHISRGLAIAAAALGAWTVPALADAATDQQQKAPTVDRAPIYVSYTGNDAIGVVLVEGLKDALKRAATLSPTEVRDEADAVLFVSTLDPDAATKPGIVTAAGWSLAIMNEAKVYVGSGLRLTDRERSRKTADDLVAHVAQLLGERKAQLPTSVDRKHYEDAWNEETARVAETIPDDACGVKARLVFEEQMETYLRLSTLANLRLDPREMAKGVAVNLAMDEGLAAKLRTQAAKLSQCQADLAALKKK
jgi:hypothetical protein